MKWFSVFDRHPHLKPGEPRSHDVLAYSEEHKQFYVVYWHTEKSAYFRSNSLVEVNGVICWTPITEVPKTDELVRFNIVKEIDWKRVCDNLYCPHCGDKAHLDSGSDGYEAQHTHHFRVERAYALKLSQPTLKEARVRKAELEKELAELELALHIKSD